MRDSLAQVLRALTPIQQTDRWILKRDDLFSVAPGSTVGGGKLRQCLALTSGHPCERLISAASIHSPQSAIVSFTARYLGLRCLILVGGTRETPSLRLARIDGAEIRRCSSGRHSVLFSKALEVARPNDFIVPFGMRPHFPDAAFFDLCSAQVENVPRDIRSIVLACGSGVTATAVALGLWRTKQAKRLVLVNVGPDRRDNIFTTLEAIEPRAVGWLRSHSLLVVEPLAQLPGFRYEKPTHFEMGGVSLHPLYEAKAFKWYTETRNPDRRRTLFWVVGGQIPDNAGEMNGGSDIGRPYRSFRERNRG